MKAKVHVYDIEAFSNYFGVTIKDPEGEILLYEVYNDINQLSEVRELFKKPNWFVGYNNKHYDDCIINYIIEHPELDDLDSSVVCKKISNLSREIIDKDDKGYKYRDYFYSIDIMKMLQKNTARKSLKMIGINLKWSLIQELPIHFEDEVTDDIVDKLRKYNVNDVEMTDAAYQKLLDDVKLRASISHQFKVNVMSESNSGITNKLLDVLYEQATGIPKFTFKHGRTPRGIMPMKSIIAKTIHFETDQLKQFLEEIRSENVTLKGEFGKSVRIGKTRYDMAKGGLHSYHNPEVIESTDDILIIDVDASSYYPRVLINLNIKPEHCSPKFIDLVRQLTDDRLEAKANIKVTEGEERKSWEAYSWALKEAVNSIYGRTGYEYHWLFDPLAMYRVTVNGQLFLLMLIEKLESSGFSVRYAK